MMQAARLTACALMSGSLAGLSGCVGADGHEPSPTARPTDFLGAAPERLGGDLVQIRASMKGAGGAVLIDDYARCVAAAFALAEGAGFVRQVRTLSGKEGGIWRADAVYSVTAALPEGLETIDAEVTVEDCATRGIPTE